ncbi:MAG: polysaccharide biosynthesis tyrosine autokinase [Actinobacteria bacterium]|nr:polysaccharide biosynthesis tyrosine autokinase [Actinomycetota bacterium]
MTLDDYLSLLWRRKWIILQAIIIVPVVTVFLALRQSPVYQASSEVLLSRSDIGSQLLGLQNTNLYTDPARFAETQAAIAQAPDLARRVIEASHVNESPGALLGSTTISPAANADLLTFSVQNGDAGAAVRLATTYARQFTVYRRQLDTGAMQTALKEIQSRLADLRNAGSTKTSEYSSLLSRAQQLKTLENLQTSNTQVIREASGAAKVKPQPRHDGIIGLLGGIVLGICLAFLAEALNKRVRSAEEIEAALHLPLLARIPEPSRDFRRADELIMLTQPSSPDAEAYRVLRTNLQFLNADAKAKVIMVTSSVAREGKSTTVSSLAIAMARGGARVALVDLDLHSPAIDRLFTIRSRPGFTEAALDLVPLDKVLQRVPITGLPTGVAIASGNGRSTAQLDVIASGTLPLNPGEFVESKAAEKIIGQLREKYDYVFIDAPPILAVSDGISLSAKVDALIVLARLDVVERGSLRDMARILGQLPAHKLGVVITGAPASAHYYYGSSSPAGRTAQRRSELVS